MIKQIFWFRFLLVLFPIVEDKGIVIQLIWDLRHQDIEGKEKADECALLL